MSGETDGPQVSMVRVLLVLAIAIPIAIEVVTFGGLVGHYFGGDDAVAATPTPETGGATVGDEILPETAATERLDAATLSGDDESRLVLTVTVTDPPDGYELRLGAVTTRAGRTVEDAGATTGALDAGEDGLVTGTWELPSGDRPEAVAVTVTSAPAGGTPTTHGYTVDLGELSG